MSDATSEGKGSTTFPAQTEDGQIVDVEKKVTLDGAAVVLEGENGEFYQPVAASGQIKDVEGSAVNVNHGNSAEGAEPEVADDNSDAVKAVEDALSAESGTRATLTASEAANIAPGASLGDFTADAPAPELPEAEAQEAAAPEADASAEADAAPEVEATPAAESLAIEEGVNLSDVEGSGADGKVTKADVEAAAADQKEA